MTRGEGRRPSPRLRKLAVMLLMMMLPMAAGLEANEVRHFRAQDRDSLLAGELDGLSVDPLGRLQLADRAERLTSIEEPFLLSAAARGDGFVVGTGNAGRVLAIDGTGAVRTLFEAPEPEVFAVWADDDGTVFAGTSPHGKVYRIAEQGGEVFFEPGETYIWALARDREGRLLVATGTDGRLYRVSADGTGEVLYDSDDTHVRSLLPLPDGGLLMGTAEEGLVLRLEADGKVRTLYDASQPEVVALALAPDGSCYAAVVASEASLVPARGASGATGDGAKSDEGAAAASGNGGGEASGMVTVSEGTTVPRRPARLAPVGGATARSEILRIAPSGLVETVWSFSEETVYALRAHGGRLWVGTGQEGKLFSRPFGDEAAMLLEKDVDERQVVALMGDERKAQGGASKGRGPAFATTNAAALFRFTGATERSGTYTSPALEAGQISRFGTLHWDGELARGSKVEFAFRSGVSSEPDATWSEWTAPRGGSEVSLSEVPSGRYLQWRATLRAGNGASPRIDGVELSYRQENLRPQITLLKVLDPGEVLVASNFNPANQVYEPAHPNREGIFTTLQEAAERPEDRRQKTLWKRGYRSLRWDASDPNGDTLTYSVEFRQLESERWLPVARELTDGYLSFDATVLPDGVYRFRLVASDARREGVDVAPGEGLTAERVSEPVLIDHTEPTLVSAQRKEDRLSLEVADAGSPLREARVSFDAGTWREVVPVDGLLDGRKERLEVEVPPGASLILLRLTDAAFNSATFDLSAELR